jgi:hypothetical protein
VSHMTYFAWRKWGISEQRNRNDFPKVSFPKVRCNLRAYGALFCNWKWIKWLRLLKKNFFLWARSTIPSIFLRVLVRSHSFPDLHCPGPGAVICVLPFVHRELVQESA